MNGEKGSAIRRVPQELWWMILDEAIDIPLLFATTYEGNDWSNDACCYTIIDSLVEGGEYEDSEKQRKIIGSVCRSWQVFAHRRKGRQIVLKSHEQRFPETGSKACRIILWGNPDEPLFAPGTSLEWEIFASHRSYLITRFANMPHPRLRRLQVWFSENNSHLYDVLRSFPNITWLDFQAWYRRGSVIETDSEPPVLPNLQVLRYKCGGFLTFPLSGISIPSLRCLYLYFPRYIFGIPLLDILLFYRQSIQSIGVKWSPLKDKVQSIKFPSWIQFPHLKELDLDQGWSIQFEPLPPNHPLQKLSAQHETFDVIPSLLEGKSIQKLTLRSAHWTTTGELIGRTVMDAERAAELWERAKMRGIQFKVIEEGGKSQDRDKVCAAAGGETLE
jgi:hypothetical protein